MWPSSSTCASRFLAVMLAVSLSVVPSINQTSYALVLINGFMCSVPIGLPSLSIFLCLTTACISLLSDTQCNHNSMFTYVSLLTTSWWCMPCKIVGASQMFPVLIFVLSSEPSGILESLKTRLSSSNNLGSWLWLIINSSGQYSERDLTKLSPWNLASLQS